jgi:prevent-host-death family protein
VAIQTTHTRLRDNLASVLDQVGADQEVVIVRRRGSPDVALIPAGELNSLWRPRICCDRRPMPSAS